MFNQGDYTVLNNRKNFVKSDLEKLGGWIQYWYRVKQFPIHILEL